MSFEIQPAVASSFNVDPQVGANEVITSGDTLILNGGNTAIQTSNGGVDTINISLVLDPAPGNILALGAGGLLLNLCDIGGFLEAQAGTVAVNNATNIPWLAGRDPVTNCLVPVNLAVGLVPFGGPGDSWGADSLYNYDAAAGRLTAPIYRTSNPPIAPTLPQLAYVEDATGDIGKFALLQGELVIGAVGGGIGTLAPGTCAPITAMAIHGLGVHPVSGDFDLVRFRERMPTRAVAANTNLLPASDGVIRVSNAGGNIVVTLNTPAVCEPNVFHVKQVNNLTTNTITLVPASGTIDGAANHVFGGTNSVAMENRMFFFDGTNWWIL